MELFVQNNVAYCIDYFYCYLIIYCCLFNKLYYKNTLLLFTYLISEYNKNIV